MKWIALTLFLLPCLANAAGPSIPLDAANNDLSDKASLQNGAKLFMNYCLGCHTTQYQRYERIAEDLEIPNELMLEHLVFDPNAKIGDLITNAITTEDAATFFSASARSHHGGACSWHRLDLHIFAFFLPR